MLNRFISDNILVAFETLHHLKNKRKGKTGFMTLKLDMSKAFDRVECDFLDKIMERLGFDGKWRKLVGCCFRLVSFSIMINGEPHGFFHPSRGLRQGDPLSPYLFLLCAEGLHSLIQQVADNGELRGVSLCKEGPKITDLFFADDSLLFCRANDTNCQIVMNILTMYEEASGQKINRGKTQLFFSTNTQEDIKNRVKDLVGVEVVTQYEKYLGMPSFVGRAKKETFSYIRERVWHKIQGWKEKLLSQADQEILIKVGQPSNADLHYGVFQTPQKFVQGH